MPGVPLHVLDSVNPDIFEVILTVVHPFLAIFVVSGHASPV